MKLLILGASSYIGSRVFFDLRDRYEITGTFNNHQLCTGLIKLDLRDGQSIEQIINKYDPGVIIHTANYSSARQIAGNEIDFNKVNYQATIEIIKIAKTFNKKLIFFSSMAATSKQNLYGTLKAESEQLIRQSGLEYFILRPSAVIGVSPNQSQNKIIDKIISVINGAKQEFDTSWILQPTYIGHISQVIDQVIKKNLWNQELSLFTDHPTTQFEMANNILSYFDCKAQSIDQGLSIPLNPSNSHDLMKFSLHPDSYEQIVYTIVNEIKNITTFII